MLSLRQRHLADLLTDWPISRQHVTWFLRGFRTFPPVWLASGLHLQDRDALLGYAWLARRTRAVLGILGVMQAVAESTWRARYTSDTDTRCRINGTITGGCWTRCHAAHTCPSWAGVSGSNEVRLTSHHFAKFMSLLEPRLYPTPSPFRTVDCFSGWIVRNCNNNTAYKPMGKQPLRSISNK